MKRMQSPALRVALLAALSVVPVWVIAQEAPRQPARPLDEPPPATQPAATQPTIVPVNRNDKVPLSMARLFADLANPDPDIRESSRIAMMGLPPEQLPELKKLAAANVPLDPSQAIALREVVTHLFLAGQPYEVSGGGGGFLGVKLGEVTIGPRPVGDDLPPEELNRFDLQRRYGAGAGNTGVVIVERMPGFCGSRMLRDGDIVLAVAERPDQPIRTTIELRQSVMGIDAGKSVTFVLLRQGRVIKVPIRLDPRPEAADGGGLGSMDILVQKRRVDADEYWSRHFGPLLKENAG